LASLRCPFSLAIRPLIWASTILRCTVLVDLRGHKVNNLLLDRKAETAKAWSLTCPEIELASRDRGRGYATATLQGTPQAVQTIDRFHLCKNLAEAVEKALAQIIRRRLYSEPASDRLSHTPSGHCFVAAVSSLSQWRSQFDHTGIISSRKRMMPRREPSRPHPRSNSAAFQRELVS
jgi:hypothetical protein